MPVKIHEFKNQRASGLLLAGERRGRGLRLSGGEMVKRGRGRPRKNMEGGDMFSNAFKLGWKTLKTKKGWEMLGKTLTSKDYWNNAINFLNDKSVKDVRSKVDVGIKKLLGVIPAVGSAMADGYDKAVVNKPVTGDFHAVMSNSIQAEKDAIKAIKDNLGIDFLPTSKYILDFDLDGFKSAVAKNNQIMNSNPAVKAILDQNSIQSRDRLNSSDAFKSSNLWMNEKGKVLYGDEAKSAREKAKAVAPAVIPQVASGLRLSGGMGCCKTGRCKMCKLVGGSRSSGFIKKLIAQEKFDLAKMKVEPSAHLKKKYSVAQPQPKKRGRKPKQAMPVEIEAVEEVQEMPIARRTRARKGAGLKLSGGASKWINHVKQYQAKHGCSYKEALQRAKQTYNK